MIFLVEHFEICNTSSLFLVTCVCEMLESARRRGSEGNWRREACK